MVALLHHLYVLSIIASLVVHALGSLDCKDVTFHAAVMAENVKFANLPDPKNDTAIIDFFLAAAADPAGPATNGTVLVSGNFAIAATYCAPPKSLDRGVLQLLVHGSTYTRSYWSGFGLSPIYDWPLFAASRGYHTLAIDRLSHGKSNTYLDPVSAIQLPLHIETVSAILVSLRKPNNPLGRSFARLVYVGHSYGSGMGVGLVANHPSSVDALVITAHSTQPYPPVIGTLDADCTVARSLPRFAALPTAGYLALPDLNVRESAFYTGNYDPRMVRTDSAHQDTCTPGELLVFAEGLTPAVAYTGPTFLLNGAEDQLLCNPKIAPCEEILNATRVLFPSGSRFDFHATPNTGHDVVLHYSAPETFGVIHGWLDEVLTY